MFSTISLIILLSAAWFAIEAILASRRVEDDSWDDDEILDAIEVGGAKQG